MCHAYLNHIALKNPNYFVKISGNPKGQGLFLPYNYYNSRTERNYICHVIWVAHNLIFTSSKGPLTKEYPCYRTFINRIISSLHETYENIHTYSLLKYHSFTPRPPQVLGRSVEIWVSYIFFFSSTTNFYFIKAFSF